MAEVTTSLLEAVKTVASRADVFEGVRVESGRLICDARDADAPAEYRVLEDAGRIWVALATENRWLSESIESELMHTGDKLEELLDEELADVGYDGDPPTYEHFRSEAMEFTFRTPLPVGQSDPKAAEIAGQFLLAYEATFRQLGDMDTTGEDD